MKQDPSEFFLIFNEPNLVVVVRRRRFVVTTDDGTFVSLCLRTSLTLQQIASKLYVLYERALYSFNIFFFFSKSLSLSLCCCCCNRCHTHTQTSSQLGKVDDALENDHKEEKRRYIISGSEQAARSSSVLVVHSPVERLTRISSCV